MSYVVELDDLRELRNWIDDNPYYDYLLCSVENDIKHIREKSLLPVSPTILYTTKRDSIRTCVNYKNDNSETDQKKRKIVYNECEQR